MKTNYLVVICSVTSNRLGHLPFQPIVIGGQQIERRETSAGGNWFVFVYSEPSGPANLISQYIQQVGSDIQNHAQSSKVEVDNIRVYFHFTNVFPGHDNRCNCGAPTIPQKRYPNHEQQLRQKTNAQGEIQVWGFHRTGKIWSTLQQLPQWLSGGGNLKQLLSNPHPRSFDDFIEALDKAAEAEEASELIKRLTILKHRLAHCFLPIDIDLQGLMETNFKQEYWEEVVEAWKGGKAYQTLEQARELLYKDKSKDDCVEKVVEEAEITNSGAWARMQELLPKCSDPPNDVGQILQYLGCQDKQNAVKEKCKGGTNPFHDWFVQLDEALDELRDAITGKAE